MTAPARFRPSMETGWLLQARRWLPGAGGAKFEHVSYWYGPDHGFGTTYGRLDYSVAVWPTRKAVKVAIGVLRHGDKILRVADAVAEEVANCRARALETKSEKTRWAMEVHLGYLTGEPILEAAGSWRRSGLIHAAEAHRPWAPALCDVKNIDRTGRRFDPTDPRACPRCKARATRGGKMATTTKDRKTPAPATTRKAASKADAKSERKPTRQRKTTKAAAKTATAKSAAKLGPTAGDLAELIEPMGGAATALRRGGKAATDVIDDVRIRARRAYSMCRRLQGLDG